MVSFFARLFGGGPPKLSDEELIRRINSKERPLTVCMDCRTLGILPPCDYCKRSAPCLEIRSRADVKNAFAALGLPEPRDIVAPPDVGPALTSAIRSATARAKKAGTQVTTEHLLLELLSDLACARVLGAFGANMEGLKQRIEASLERAPQGTGAPSAELQAAIVTATMLALTSGKDIVDTTDALNALSRQTSPAAELLRDVGISFRSEA